MQEISHQGLDSASGTTLWKLVFEWTIWRQEVNVKLRIRELYGVAWCTSLQFAMFQICGTIQLHGTGTRPHTQTTSVVSTHAITTSSIPAINCKHQMFSIWIRIFKAVQRANLDIGVVMLGVFESACERKFLGRCRPSPDKLGQTSTNTPSITTPLSLSFSYQEQNAPNRLYLPLHLFGSEFLFFSGGMSRSSLPHLSLRWGMLQILFNGSLLRIIIYSWKEEILS